MMGKIWMYWNQIVSYQNYNKSYLLKFYKIELN